MVTVPITIVLACDFYLQYSITDKAGVVAINVATMNLSWLLKKLLTQPDSAALLPEKTTANGKIIVSGVFNTDPTLNLQIVTVLLGHAETATLKPGTAQHELKCMDFPETVFTNGPATLQQGVHRT